MAFQEKLYHALAAFIGLAENFTPRTMNVVYEYSYILDIYKFMRIVFCTNCVFSVWNHVYIIKNYEIITTVQSVNIILLGHKYLYNQTIMNELKY